MPLNVAQKLIASHLLEGEMIPGGEIALHIDQTLKQDATGTLVMLDLEARGTARVQTELSVRQIEIVIAGGLINWVRDNQHAMATAAP